LISTSKDEEFSVLSEYIIFIPPTHLYNRYMLKKRDTEPSDSDGGFIIYRIVLREQM
jgi:hypothetical protein